MTGFYVSPEKNTTACEEHTTQTNIADSDSDDDSDIEPETVIDANQQAEKHFAEILNIVDKKVNKQKASKHTTTATISTTGPTSTTTNEQNAFPVHSDDDSHTFDDYAGSEPSTTEEEAPSVDAIKDLVVRHILNVLNTGTYDEVRLFSVYGEFF